MRAQPLSFDMVQMPGGSLSENYTFEGFKVVHWSAVKRMELHGFRRRDELSNDWRLSSLYSSAELSRSNASTTGAKESRHTYLSCGFLLCSRFKTDSLSM